MSKFIIFRELRTKHCGFRDWAVVNEKKDFNLGIITYNWKWKKWCFEPDEDTFYCSLCLKEICEFMDTLNKK